MKTPCVPPLLSEAERWLAARQLEVQLSYVSCEGFDRILGQGKDWCSSVYLALVTDFLEQGLTSCVIGTRGLLGEGWDCRSLNTLIDLTAVTSFVSVNQIRGRSLRFDPRYPLKLSNLWDVIALIPELEGGFRDLERFQRKFQHFYGLSEDGVLERGPGHVHSLLAQIQPQEMLVHMENLNQEMIKRAQQRQAAWERWEIGKPFRGQDREGLQLRWPLLAPGHASAQGRSQPRLKQIPVRLQRQSLLIRQDLFRAQLGHTLGRACEFGLGLGLSLFTPEGEGIGLALLSLFLVELGLFQWRSWLKARIQHRLLPETEDASGWLRQLAELVCSALQEADLIARTGVQLHFSQRSDGSLRIFLDSPHAQEAGVFAQALQELLEPLQEQKYLVQLELLETALQPRWYQPPQLRIQSGSSLYLPVPRLLARSRERAEIFAAQVQALLGPCQLIYTRQGAGREKLQHLLRQRALQVQMQKLQIWE